MACMHWTHVAWPRMRDAPRPGQETATQGRRRSGHIRFRAGLHARDTSSRGAGFRVSWARLARIVTLTVDRRDEHDRAAASGPEQRHGRREGSRSTGRAAPGKPTPALVGVRASSRGLLGTARSLLRPLPFPRSRIVISCLESSQRRPHPTGRVGRFGCGVGAPSVQSRLHGERWAPAPPGRGRGQGCGWHRASLSPPSPADRDPSPGRSGRESSRGQPVPALARR